MSPQRAPRLLALDTSTEVLSLAVSDGEHLFTRTSAGGAAASRTLVPAALALLAEAGLALRDLDAIAFGRGPGSFTGLRTACAVAQGFAFGAELPLLPVDSLLAVAEDARLSHGVSRVVAVLDARMDQVYAAAHDFSDPAAVARSGLSSEPCLMAPEELRVPEGWALVGNADAAYGDRLGASVRLSARPTAAALISLAPGLLAAGLAVAAREARPAYIRDKVAQTTEERLAARAARSPSPAP